MSPAKKCCFLLFDCILSFIGLTPGNKNGKKWYFCTVFLAFKKAESAYFAFEMTDMVEFNINTHTFI
jgi:hypothetical protein